MSTSNACNQLSSRAFSESINTTKNTRSWGVFYNVTRAKVGLTCADSPANTVTLPKWHTFGKSPDADSLVHGACTNPICGIIKASTHADAFS